MWYTEVGFEKRTRIGSWLHCRFNDVAFLRDKNAREPHVKASGFVAVLGSDNHLIQHVEAPTGHQPMPF